jgi:hypothetical protein
LAVLGRGLQLAELLRPQNLLVGVLRRENLRDADYDGQLPVTVNNRSRNTQAVAMTMLCPEA